MKIATIHSRPFSRHAFTMVEIAIALAVIGFALMAIVGLLPQGLNTQRDNREDTVISQDGAYFLEAIRSGTAAQQPILGTVQGLDNLTNYVEQIMISNPPSSFYTATATLYIRGNGSRTTSNKITVDASLTNGARIISLLGTPKYVSANNAAHTEALKTNVVIALVRALSGPVNLVGTSTNTAFIFHYQLRSEITPFVSWMTNYNSVPTNLTDWTTTSNHWAQTAVMNRNLYELRLRLSWPVLPTGNLSDAAKTVNFRSTISAAQLTNGAFTPLNYQYP